ncbi:GAF and ANTAR domain-containing protein [Williamsia deligens]|uniref:GAF and ANTAR domain-containing protein n=1 Tax=Williamsia deligens TaxID=321325 RepID=A0ABW3G7X1_9NOCA|nr:ANTAR domain-containing protein [Williamsia deligens]
MSTDSINLFEELSAMTPAVHAHAEIARMSAAAQGAGGPTPSMDEVLDSITASARTILPQVDHVSLSLVHRDRFGRVRRERTVAGGELSQLFADTQWDSGSGPGIDAVVGGREVLVDDVDTEPRWPDLMALVRARTPIKSMLCVRIALADRDLGILVLHSERRHAFRRADAELASLLGVHAAVAVSTARRADQFTQALASRDVIGQAKGMVMERFDVDADRAFAILARLSQETNTPVAVVARRLVDIDHPAREGSEGLDAAGCTVTG